MEANLKQQSYEYITRELGVPLESTHPSPVPVVLLSSNAVVPLSSVPLGRVEQRVSCPSCHNMMQTRLERRANRSTHLFALAFCLTGLVCLVPLPYFLKSCCSLDHYCSACNQYVGKAVG